MLVRLIACCGAALLLAPVSPVAARQSDRAEVLPDDVRYGLLTPLPDRGGVPPIVELMSAPSQELMAQRAKTRTYARQVRVIRRRHLGSIRVPEIRRQGIERLREFTDPASFPPIIEELADEADDVRFALLDHFAGCGDEGQAALAWVAIHDEDDAIRHEAMRRMTAPALPVLRVLDSTLRSSTHGVANHAGTLTAPLGAVETIPLLIFAQATRDPAPQDEGDLAWIAIQTQQAYTQNLVPVVGDSSGAFQPVVGVVSEGVVLRVMDAIVIVYRTEIHRSLVAMTSGVMGESTAHLGYDMRGWWEWYNIEYVPHRNEQLRRERLAEAPPADEADDGSP